jgi:hypothetical protein
MSRTARCGYRQHDLLLQGEMGHGPCASAKQGIVGSIPASRTKKDENLRRKLQAFSGFFGLWGICNVPL